MTPTQNQTFKKMSLVFAAAGLFLSACATQADRSGPTERQGPKNQARASGVFVQPIAVLFSDLDTNKDKIFDRTELEAGIKSEWGKFRRKPTAVQFSQWSLTNLGSTDALPNFMSFDKDFNGVIIESEFTAQLEKEFKRLDKNQDGRVVRSEMLVTFQAPMGRSQDNAKQEDRPKRGQGGGRRSR